jgi:hypothetical protein
VSDSSDRLDNDSPSSVNIMGMSGAKRVGAWEAMPGIRRLHVSIGLAGILIFVATLGGCALQSNSGVPANSGVSAGASDYNDCTDYPDVCGLDYQVPREDVGSPTDQSTFVVAVNDGVTRARVEQIAQGFAARHSSSPTVVYVVPYSARWDSIILATIPNPLKSSNLDKLPDPTFFSNWILTYASIPSTPPLERWGPGSANLAMRRPEPLATRSRTAEKC